ncbi:hypothetical protein GUITHDRAFT_152983 [Guillardia theta CCMP2712]|uniref:Gamma carbonic anhydrase n=1 Tax=Guillardia theta (strain CCMP2712) TaxID=905079 RepID=L1J8X3_GUITC|nr:hypothetical protein GUITHDRAFT_152983 [Guillardia theta CCMP2712]EKX44520.1 hypothetical protein GUITHDRAFT_152983 [Guillardia theta CCMP2712]|eukprot:XP_005831500.1 hypothetical protein GUITHDRAFT_152983 [Guillardia theta CCMP2712]
MAWAAGQALRETGVALERLACRMLGDLTYKEPLSCHRNVMRIFSDAPKIKEGCFVAPTASVIGKVTLGTNSNVWYSAVVRGDRSNISIGNNCNVMERAVLNPTSGEIAIGDNVTVGAGAVIRAAKIGSGCMVGASAVLEDSVVVEDGAAVGPGAVVPASTVVPAGQIFTSAGLRALKADELAAIAAICGNVSKMAPVHTAECNKSFKDIEKEKEGYEWQQPLEDGDPMGLLSQDHEKSLQWQSKFT